MKLQNIRPNLNMVDTGNLRVWFSYETPIAFRKDGSQLVVSQNVWSVTTAKHLNCISSKDERIPHAEFTKQLNEVRGS